MDVNYLNAKMKEVGDVSKRTSAVTDSGSLREVELSSKWKSEVKSFQVGGSTAGAGSGDFHVFKNQRRREMFRLKRMYDDALTDKLDNEYEEKKESRAGKEDARTERNRLKRLKRKAAKRRKAEEAKGAPDKSAEESAPAEAPASGAATEAGAPAETMDEVEWKGETPKFVQDQNGDLEWVRVAVHVRTDAHMSRITNKESVTDDATLQVDVATPGDKKSAVNNELRSYIAHLLGCAKGNVDIMSGHGDKEKILHIQGRSVGQIMSCLTR